ncbi:terpene synthase family protein [Streptomyces sp. NPDC002851]
MSADTLLTVPPFYCPIPPVNRPDAEDVEHRALKWITDMGAYTDRRRLDALAAAQAGIVIPQAMPHALPDRVQIAADFMYWGFTFDDCHFEEGPLGDRPEEAIEYLGRMSRVAQAPSAALLPDDPWARALRDLRRRVDACATHEQSQRWAAGIQRLLSGLAWETRYRGRGICPDLDTYLMIRLGSIGMEPLTALNDLADGYLLPARTYHAPVVRALTEMCWTLIICDNDLYSYNKEAVRRPNELNYLNCLAKEHHITPQQALPRAVALRDSIMSLFLRVRERAYDDASPELHRYLTSLGQWLRANLDWALGSRRYRPDPGAPRYTDQATDTGEVPVPLASIAWWWQLEGVRPAPGDVV